MNAPSVENAHEKGPMQGVGSGTLVRRLWQVGEWHKPDKKDPMCADEEMAISEAKRLSLHFRENVLFCCWEWAEHGGCATERYLVINGQVWRPA